MKYNLFIGRYQSPHKGHQEIFNTYLKNGEPVLIAIRDIEPDFENPLTTTTTPAPCALHRPDAAVHPFGRNDTRDALVRLHREHRSLNHRGGGRKHDGPSLKFVSLKFVSCSCENFVLVHCASSSASRLEPGR